MARYALIDEQGEVVNLIEWDGVTPCDVSPLTVREATPDDIAAFVAPPESGS